MANILIVDDERDLVELVKVILARDGHAVREAFDGVEALSVLGVAPESPEGFKPDLILVDVWMPQLDGPGLARRLAQAPKTSAIPLLVLTAKDQVTAQFSSVQSVAGFISKPFEPKDLRDAVARVLRKR
ncbi:MAG TPA: two-component system response regulator [Elusimicrobia bacterium]|nr:two-component system response regulator [Elusimicrobiota bacterium]